MNLFIQTISLQGGIAYFCVKHLFMTNFHTLKVKEVKRETSDAVSILFDVPQDLKATFQFVQGQYLTLRTNVDGEDVRRSYSICSSPFDEELRVAVKQIPNGKFSTYANTTIAVGDAIDVMAPLGNFNTKVSADQEKNYAAFASGSGITPIMSIIRAVLKTESESVFTLFYGNRSKETIIFNSDLEDLQRAYPDRLQVHHVLSRDASAEQKFSGRLSAEKCRAYHQDLIDMTELDEVFLCGPEAMIFDIKEALIDIGLPENSIHFELFTTSASEKKVVLEEEGAVVDSQVEVIVYGESFHFELSSDGDAVLDAAMAADADVPFACKGGVCCACRAKVIEGSVKMDVNFGLDESEVNEGYVLACQSHPTSEKLVIDFDDI